MPSFDIVSELDKTEVTNAVDQANREVSTRFDFKGSNARCDYVKDKGSVTLRAESDFQLTQLIDILREKLTKRDVDVRHMDVADPVITYKKAEQVLTFHEGIQMEAAKNIIKLIKSGKFKVQAAIQGDQVRVTGKKRDDLQAVIAMLEKEKLNVPLQFKNFRD